MQARALPCTITNWVDTLVSFDYDVIHTPGAENIGADAFSCMYKAWLHTPQAVVNNVTDLWVQME